MSETQSEQAEARDKWRKAEAELIDTQRELDQAREREAYYQKEAKHYGRLWSESHDREKALREVLNAIKRNRLDDVWLVELADRVLAAQPESSPQDNRKE